MANPFNPSMDPDLFALVNPPPAAATMRHDTPPPQSASAFALDDVEKTPPPFFNSLPALANLSSSPVLPQGPGWGESGAAEGSQQRKKVANKIMRREEVEAAVQDGLLRRLAEHALALEDLHNLERQSSDRTLSSLKSQHSALALTHQSALDRLALKDAEISSLKAQAAALYSKASVVRSAPSASPDPNVSVFSTAAVYAPLVRQSPKMDYPPGSPVRGSADQKPNGAFNDYAPAFQPFLDRARDEEASERLEATKRALQSDRKFLRRRLHDSDAQVRTLTHELKRLRHHLLSAAPTIIPAPEAGPIESIEVEGEDDDDDDGPDYPYDGTPPLPRELPLPPVGDESAPRAGHQRSHTFPTAFKPRLPKARSSKRWKRRPTMGDAEAEHLLLASRTLSSVVRPIPRPPDVMLSRGGPALTPLEAATYLPPGGGGGGHRRTPSGGIARVEEEDEDELGDDGLSPKGLYGQRRTSDVRNGLPFEIHSPGRGAPLPSDTPGLIRHGKVADAPPVKRGRHGASASLGSASAFGQQHPGTGAEVFALPQTPRSSGQHRSSVAVGSPTRSGGIEDLLAAAETVLVRSTSPSTRKRPNAEDGTPRVPASVKRRRVDEEEGEATPKQAGGQRSSSAPLPGADYADDEEVDEIEDEAGPVARGYPSALDVLADQAFASASQSSQESTASPPRQHAYVFPSQQPQQPPQHRYPSVLLPAPPVSGVNGAGGGYRPPSSPQHQTSSSTSSYHGSRPYIPPPELTPAAAAAKKARSPYVKWTFQEDELLVRAVCEHGQRWDAVSKGVPTRSYHQCRQRWLRGLKSGENLPRELQHYYPAVKTALRAHASMRSNSAANAAGSSASKPASSSGAAVGPSRMLGVSGSEEEEDDEEDEGA